MRLPLTKRPVFAAKQIRRCIYRCTVLPLLIRMLREKDTGFLGRTNVKARSVNFYTGRASPAYRNAICFGANLSAIFTSGCPWAVCMSHTHATNVRSTMSDIAVINHSDCKNLYAWVTQRSVVAMFDLESDATHCACVVIFSHRQ